MNLAPAFSWFASLRWQRARPVALLDFADMGTAFGLDASLDSEPSTTMPAVFMKNGRSETGAPEQQATRADRRKAARGRR
jgi:hypothetical protein